MTLHGGHTFLKIFFQDIPGQSRTFLATFKDIQYPNPRIFQDRNKICPSFQGPS